MSDTARLLEINRANDPGDEIKLIKSSSGSSVSKAAPRVYRGNGVTFRVGVFSDDETPEDLSDITSLTLKYQAAYNSSSAIAEQTVANAAFESEVITRADFLAGTDWHAEFTFSDADMNPSLGGEQSNAFHLVLKGVTGGGRSITFGTAVLTIYEDDNATVADPPGNATAFTTAEGEAYLDALFETHGNMANASVVAGSNTTHQLVTAAQLKLAVETHGVVDGGNLTSTLTMSSLVFRDVAGNHTITIDTAGNVTANRTVWLDVGDANRSFALGGNVSFGGNVTTTGDNTLGNSTVANSTVANVTAANSTITGATVTGTHTGNSTGNNTGDLTLGGNVSGGSAYLTLTAGNGTQGPVVNLEKVPLGAMGNLSAQGKVIGRKSSGAGAPEECAIGEILDLLVPGAGVGSIAYKAGSGNWTLLQPGTSGLAIVSAGNGTAPAFGYSSPGYVTHEIGARLLRPNTTDGASAYAETQTATDIIMLGYIGFADGAGQYASGVFRLPEGAVGSTLKCRLMVSSTATGTAILRLRGHGRSSGQSIDIVRAYVTPSMAFSIGTANYYYITDSFDCGGQWSGLSAGAMVDFMLRRDGTDGLDTLGGSLRVHSVLFQWLQNPVSTGWT